MSSIPFLVVAFLFGCFLGGLFAYTLRKVTVAALHHTIARLEQALLQQKNEHVLVQERYMQANNELAAEKAALAHLATLLKGQERTFEHLQNQMTVQFKNIANELLEEKSKKFTDHAHIQMEQLLTPLGEKITAFEKQVVHVNQESLARNVALRTELKQLHELNIKITHEAESLTKAIKGDSKFQGGWGEFILENILAQSGLVKNREYAIQTSVTDPNGQRFQPDVVVHLPGKKQVVIDAKVSLTHYELFFNTEDPTQRIVHLKQHIGSIKRHIKTLSEKKYQLMYDLQGLDFVLMFIPIEPAFSLAIQEEISIFNEAYERNIVIVSPTNLIATLRTIANIWRQEHQNQHALEIAHQGGALYDKFVSFIEDLKAVGRQIDLIQKNYVEATKKLYEGRGSLIARAEKMKKLGARTSKAFEQQLLDRVAHEMEMET